MRNDILKDQGKGWFNLLLNVRTAAIVLASACVSLAQNQQPKSGGTKAVSESVTQAVDNTLIKSMTLEVFQKLVQGMGFECSRGKDENGKDETFFTFRAEGYKVAAFVPDPSFIELYNAFTDVAPTPTVVNEWNQANRFSRAYVDNDGRATIEDDLILTGGVTHENVESFVKTFRDTVSRWARFVIDHKPKDAPR